MIRIGVDGGGTTTRAVAVDENLRVLGRGEAGPGNFYSAGESAAVGNIVAAIRAACESAGIRENNVAGWGLGLAGAVGEDDKSRQRDALLPYANDAQVIVDEDAAAAQSGAFAGGAGAICIAGTGSNCFGINDRGERRRADGNGPLLGDRGSGYWCGEQALRAACAGLDGAAPATALYDAVLQQLGATDLNELIQVVYAPDFKKDRIAALFPTLMQIAKEGDAVAQEILERAGQELARTTLAVIQPLNINRVAPVGGILSNETPVRAAFESALRAAIADIQIVEPQHDAAIGAALLVK
jgi:N-acetylglucosamine kinase-like BadF-type ATPase